MKLRFIDRRPRARLLAAVFLFTSLLAACNDGSSPKPSGAAGRVVSPNGAEGAAIIEFSGVVSSINVPGGVGYLSTSGGVTRAALILEQPGTIRFSLPGVAIGAGPAATVIEVADGGNQPRAAVAGYTVAYDQ
jgi:hypothetical protein